MGFRDLTSLQRRYTGEAGRLVDEFYVPVLGEAVAYDRQTGFFNSASLVQSAAGLAAFIQRALKREAEVVAPPRPGPAMRLVVGGSWSEEDVRAVQLGYAALDKSLGASLVRHFTPTDEECVELGLPAGWRPEHDQIAKHRLGALAWLVARGLLEVKIAFPLDELGRPYRPGRNGALYHPKAGILYDGTGDIVSFQGSVNETSAAWARNREKFEVKRSWHSDDDRDDIQAEIEEFNKIWQGHDPGLAVRKLPEAVQEKLIEFAPPDAPVHDPLQRRGSVGFLADRLAARFLLDAPRLRGGERLVRDPLLLKPFPHQERVAERVVAEYPRRFLFCDEVGLGKTIEAGLALRALQLRGDLRRVLIITPRSLVTQWQEELREKFALTAWFYDGSGLTDVGGRERRPPRSAWSEDGFVIVSRSLISRRARRGEVLGVEKPWDLVIVDEAHAARRQVFRQNSPNQLLDLLQDLHDHALFGSLWLLTATPMQLHPAELHDLLQLSGVADPPWGSWASEPRFERFFSQLRAFPRDRQVRAEIFRMARVAVKQGAPAFDPQRLPADWDQFDWSGFANRANSNNPALALDLQALSESRARALTPFLARQSPLAVHMFRYTRTTLREYQRRGLLAGSVPYRDPVDVPIAFADAREQELYDRIDELCERFYRLLDYPESQRQGLGFLRAVFRKRLASSFYAFQKTLERRRSFLLQAQYGSVDSTLVTDLTREAAEEEEEEGAIDPDDFVGSERERVARLRAQQIVAELDFLQDYIRDLGSIQQDSKFTEFAARLEALLARGQRVIVFTQYVETLDFIRDQLAAGYAGQLACYSGRGGEVWDPVLNRWRIVDRAEIKRRASVDNPQTIRILLGTDAASEGLNLQQFSALINYDLPWNPMRVEQRIGRIDRIGQVAERVSIANLYIEGSIEQDAYQVLRQRIGFFQDVVGPLQPILAEMPRLFLAVARGEMEREDVRRELERLASQEPSSPLQRLDEYTRADADRPTEAYVGPPVTQDQLSTWCIQHLAPGLTLVAAPEPGSSVENHGVHGCFRLTWPDAPLHLGIGPTDTLLVTFNSNVADRHPPTAPRDDDDGLLRPGSEGVRYLTWGDPLLHAWLETIAGNPLSPAELASLGILRDAAPVAYRRAGRDAARELSFRQIVS
jgi:superfamily II DNA or RNA helicase